MTKYFLFLLLTIAISLKTASQVSYSDAMQQAKDSTINKDYPGAIKLYNAAKAFEPSMSNVVDDSIKSVFSLIIQQKKEAEALQIKAENAQGKAEALQKNAEKDRDKIRDQTLKIAANEYVRLIREGPSTENNNDKEFYGNNYFLAYTAHIDTLENLVTDSIAFRALKNKLYYNNDLYQRLYENLAKIDTLEIIIKKDNPAVPDASTKREGFVSFTRSRNQHLQFGSTNSNFIIVFNSSNEKPDSIGMGTEVTALYFNDDDSIIYFGTISGYIGYIKYRSDRKNQPIFQNKLETEITAIQLFTRSQNNEVDTFLLAAGKNSSPVVYNLNNVSLNPYARLIGNELPYEKKYGNIMGAEYQSETDRVRLFTTNGSYTWNPFTKEVLDKLKYIEHFTEANSSISKTQIY